MKVRDIMTKDVVCLNPEDAFSEIVGIFSEKKISGAPVAEGKKLVGMVSESDILRFVAENKMLDMIEKGSEKLKEKILTRTKTIMKKKMITVGPNDDVAKVVDIINKNDINRVPVTEKGEVVGIITRADVVSIVSEYMSKNPVVKTMEWKMKAPRLETDIDSLYALVKEKKCLKFSEASKRFSVSENKIEEWGKILEEYNFVTLHYPPVGEPMLKVIHEKKKKQV